jgi:hypothetical protein
MAHFSMENPALFRVEIYMGWSGLLSLLQNSVTPLLSLACDDLRCRSANLRKAGNV